jgi:hypothetical protein
MSNIDTIKEALELAIQQAQDIIDGGESAKDALQDQLNQLEEEGTFYASDVNYAFDVQVGLNDLEESIEALEGFGPLEPTASEEPEEESGPYARTNAREWSWAQYREIWLVRRLLGQAAIVAGSVPHKADAMRSLAARIAATAESRRQGDEPKPTILDWAGDKAYVANLTDRRWLGERDALDAADRFVRENVLPNKRAELVEDPGEVSAYFILGLDACYGV